MTGRPSPGKDALVLAVADVVQIKQFAVKGSRRCPLVVPRPVAFDVAGVRIVVDLHGSGESALLVGLVSPDTCLFQPLVVLLRLLAGNGLK